LLFFTRDELVPQALEISFPAKNAQRFATRKVSSKNASVAFTEDMTTPWRAVGARVRRERKRTNRNAFATKKEQEQEQF
jgi:hypothetical protein